ncbi:23S rRNA (uracil(1939)-C(5))-methyltransferase RlmD [Vreelandella salicampi]|uniref:23S rRNA (uracil(1939)-C(5))-methyltransferase RlmD n=1 Tax=Vreelandella salicampi TaxID=1449798 RepID=A0A7Z0LM17_9GAMM|nr:23S rRNA (uracil(1939)-C(5))-methyltransferase RlmD [Halomonas salicampi]NYS61428.1 23S rRNA (uracil(1939)-C(5))-methyltransferase RlmD [Halomonas salicampi]
MAMLGKRRPPRPASNKSGLARQESAKQAPKAETSSEQVLIIERLAHDGRGVGHLPSGKAVFVDQALPGERIEIATHVTRKRFDEAHIRERLSTAADRVTPPCPHFGHCGGCDLQHLSVPAQREHKREVVRELLSRQGLTWQGDIDTLKSDSDAYRRRARLGVNVDREGQVLMGFRAQRSHRLVDIASCCVLVPELQALIAPLRDLLGSLKSPRDIGHIELLATPDTCVVVVRQLKEQPQDAERWKSFAQEQGVALGMRSGRDNVGHDSIDRERIDSDKLAKAKSQAGAPEAHWFGAPPVLNDTLTLAGFEPLTLEFSPGDFLQVNADVNQQMVAQVIQWLAPQKGQQLLDLYSGIGNFSLPIAATGAKVHAVEGNPAMVARLAANAHRHQLPVNGQQADLNSRESVNALLKVIPADAVILDPPRGGAESVCQALAKLSAKTHQRPRIAYVSCDPATLARDAAHLMHGGYRITRVVVADMFVHTAHMETLMLLEPSV